MSGDKMKTPEELVEDYTSTLPKRNLDVFDIEMAFLAGYQAGRLNSEAVPAAAPQWISVKDRLPENRYITVLVDFKVPDSKAKLYGFGYCENDESIKWYVDHNGYAGIAVEVTHWMPLPKPPEE